MAKTSLKKVQQEAKKIRTRHPNMSNAVVMKKAWSKARGGKVSGVKKSKRRTGKKKAVGSHKPKYKCVHEVRRVAGISYTGGKVSIKGAGETNELRDNLKGRVGQEIGWLEVAKSSAKTARERNALQKKINEKKAELRKLS